MSYSTHNHETKRHPPPIPLPYKYSIIFPPILDHPRFLCTNSLLPLRKFPAPSSHSFHLRNVNYALPLRLHLHSLLPIVAADFLVSGTWRTRIWTYLGTFWCRIERVRWNVGSLRVWGGLETGGALTCTFFFDVLRGLVKCSRLSLWCRRWWRMSSWLF